MRVFISWSGDRSRLCGDALRRFLRRVLPGIRPWFSPDDVGKGVAWQAKIRGELDECDAGILCITNENRDSNWIHFEAGALSKKLATSMVVPYLLDFAAASLRPPLAMFNVTVKEREDTLRLFHDLNAQLQHAKLTSIELEESFDKWWPDFIEALDAIRTTTEPAPPEVSEQEQRLAAIESSLRQLVVKSSEHQVQRRRKLSDRYPFRYHFRLKVGATSESIRSALYDFIDVGWKHSGDALTVFAGDKDTLRQAVTAVRASGLLQAD